jgi:23S rRNA (adenine-N6)-dimethyltransferase
VLDVGAGTGRITDALLAVGARVIAVELHPQRAQILRERFRNVPVVVVQADAADLRLPRRPFRVVANPPFGASTGLLRRLLVPGNHMLSANLVLPRYAAARWSDACTRRSARWTTSFDVRISGTVSRSAFVPVTKADALVLRIERRT